MSGGHAGGGIRLAWSLPGGGPTAWSEASDGIRETLLDADAPGCALPATQPGVHDADGGFRSHRMRIRFLVPGAVAAGVQLALIASAERGPVPDLAVELDGRLGVIHPRVRRVDRSETGEPGPVAGILRAVVDFPAEWLGPGPHELIVTTVLDAAAALGERGGRTHELRHDPGERLPAARTHYGSWFGSYLRWHGISLGPADPAAAHSEVRGTPFVVAGSDGREEQLLEVLLARGAGDPPPDADLRIDGVPVPLPAWPADRAFGELRIRTPLPVQDARRAAVLTVGDRTVEARLDPVRRWTLHLVPHVHLDLGFTAVQGSVLELHCRNIDRALDRMDVDPGFRFQVDGAVIAEEYAATRTPERVARMRAAVADGRLGVNVLHSNPLSGLMSLPELLHSVDVGSALPEPTTGRVANLTDVPTASRSLVPVLAGAGVRGFVGMANHGRAATDDSDALHLASPVRWRAADGSELLAFVADHYSQLRFIVADPQSVAGGVDGLGRLLERYDRSDYRPSDLPVIGTHADNEDLADGDTGFVERWNAEFLWPRMRVSTFGEYLAAVEPLREDLPVWDRELGTFWEDGAGSATAAFARYRRAQALLPAAETLSALVASGSAGLRSPSATFARARSALVVGAEHTITWARSTTHPHGQQVADQLEWKTRHIDDALRVGVDESRRALAQTAEREGLVGPGVLVYNPHPWTLDLPVEVELADGIELSDAAGPIATELVESCAGLRRVRFLARNLPAHGWRYLPASAWRATVPGGEKGTTERAELSVHGFTAPEHPAVIGTDTWRIELDGPGGLPRRLLHRPTGRELLDPAAGPGLGMPVRVGPSPWREEESAALEHPDDVHEHRRRRSPAVQDFRYVPHPPPDALIEESPELRFVGIRTTPDGVRLRWTGAGAGLDRTEIELVLDDVAAGGELTVGFDKRAVLDTEAVYVAFPFAGAAESLRHDRPLGWVRPAEDHGPGASNAWLTATHVVALSATTHELWWSPRDAPLFSVGDIVRGTWPRAFAPRSATIWSYAANNAWPCNVPPAQTGRIELAYSFRTADRGEPDAGAARFGRAARQPALTLEILPLDRFADGPSGPGEGSLGLAADPGTSVDVFGDEILVGDLAGDSRDRDVDGETIQVPAHGFVRQRR